MPIQTIGEADAFFASLPDGPDAVQDFAAALPPAGAAAYIPVAGTAGKTAVASLTAGILAAAGFRTGLYDTPSDAEHFGVSGVADTLTQVAPMPDANTMEKILEALG